MVAVDTTTGTPVRVSGAALAGGPALTIGTGRRLDWRVWGAGGESGGEFSDMLRRAPASPGRLPGAGELAARSDVMPAQWGIPAFFGGAAFGPPYELPNRTVEWLLSVDVLHAFRPVDEQSRRVQRVHPRGPALRSMGEFLSVLFGAGLPSRQVGVTFDADA
jgi:hypothetical protein